MDWDGVSYQCQCIKLWFHVTIHLLLRWWHHKSTFKSQFHFSTVEIKGHYIIASVLLPEISRDTKNCCKMLWGPVKVIPPWRFIRLLGGSMENLLDLPDMMGDSVTYRKTHPIQCISLSHSHTGDNVSCHQPCQEPVIHVKRNYKLSSTTFW